MQNIYSFKNYVELIKWKISLNTGLRAYKMKLAEAAQCQASFLSQVLGGSIHLTPDHGMGLSEYWGLNSLEKDYFLTLIHLARAGGSSLKDFYNKKLDEIRSRSEKLSDRFEVDTFADDQVKAAIYYSSWMNTAVHMLTSLKSFKSIEQIANYFSIPAEQAHKILIQLEQLGFVQNKNDKWTCTKNNIHVAKESPLFPVYHQQWRQQCIQSLDKDKNSLNYTSLYTLSKSDQTVLKNMILEFIEKTRTLVTESAEEKLTCFALDFFEVR